MITDLIPPVRIVLLGDPLCGKTTLACAFAEIVSSDANWNEHTKALLHDGSPVAIDVLDCQGPVDDIDLQRLWRSGDVDEFLLCFVLGDAASWDRVTGYWLMRLRECGAPFMLVGTHADRLSRAERGDTLEFLADFAASEAAQCFRHTSLGQANSAAQVDAVFQAALRSAVYQREQRWKAERQTRSCDLL